VISFSIPQKGKQGYWDGVKFQEQCTDFMDVLEILYPDMQILLEVDHSSGHLKEQPDGSKYPHFVFSID
jgi:hypothetical protein